MRILGYLDAISLGRAAQVNQHWKTLADDDLLWRRMCGQHIDRKCEKCGWGLPLLERRRLKVELKDRSPAAAVGVGSHEHEHDHHHGHEATKLVTRVEALGGKGPLLPNIAPSLPTVLKKRTVCDPATFNATLASAKRAASPELSPAAKRFKQNAEASGSSSSLSLTKAESSREVRLTRPWKTVYCERLVVERNWRKGRCQPKTLKGHKDGVMCLQYHMSLTSPSYPVLITGSYDRTVRIWNLDTGEEVRTLVGHTRAVRALQFDQMLLFTGGMDGTVRMWNWKRGECLRILEGHSDGVVSLNYNGYLLATGSADSTANVWNLRTGNKFSLRGHDGWVNAVLLWDGKTSPGDVDPTQIPSFTRNRCVSPGVGAGGAEASKGPEIDPGTILFTASDDETIKMWDLETQECIRTFQGHKAQVQSLKLLMVDMSEDEMAEDDRRRDLGREQTAGHLHPTSQPLSSTGNVCTGSVEPRVYVHVSAEKLKKEKHEPATEHAERRKKPVLVSGSLDGTVRLWDVETGKEVSTFFGHIEGVWAVDIDALRMASASHGESSIAFYTLTITNHRPHNQSLGPRVWQMRSHACGPSRSCHIASTERRHDRLWIGRRRRHGLELCPDHIWRSCGGWDANTLTIGSHCINSVLIISPVATQ